MKTFITFSLVITTILMANAQTPKTYNLIVGTYTNPGKSNGMYVYAFNAETGELTHKSESPAIKNPSFLTVSNDMKHVYAVSEDGKGTVNAYKYDAASGKLEFLNSAPVGDGPCYVSVDSKNKFAFVGNYGGGSLAAVPINPDGSLGDKVQSIQHSGSSINKGNQEKPHVHATLLSKDDKYLFVPDLGTDKINIYQVDVSKPNPLTPASQPFVSITPGGGPRHFTFHPNGKYAFLIHEITGVVTPFEYANGKLTAKESVSLVAQGATGRIDAADIHLSPDGKFLYGSLRGDINEIVVCSIDNNGKLAVVGRQSTLGKTPRNFAIDPTGKFLLVGNQNSDNIIVFKRNEKTGLLTATGTKLSIGAPVCLVFTSSK